MCSSLIDVYDDDDDDELTKQLFKPALPVVFAA